MDSSSTEKKVALGISGGIAAYKAAEVLRGLQRAGCTVRVGMTKRACEFVQPLTFRALSGSHVIVDDYAPDNPDPIAHITFSQTVDLFLIAPATANIIGKLAHGIADDFLTSTYLACTAPVLIAPAMNTSMWHHPATQRNLQQLRADGVIIIEPDEGEMACGTIGPGRLSEPERIVAAALEILENSRSERARDLAGEHLLITVGATREAIDPVRFLSNNSSGRMGFAIAEAARYRGADVTLIAGITNTPPPRNVEIIRVNSAEEMHAAVMKDLPGATIFIGAAAVADYRPVKRSPEKIKKTEPSLSLELERTPDILREVAEAKQDGLLVIGFAAETENVLQNARKKLNTKSLDAIVANDVSRDGVGFDTVTNEVTIISRDRKAPIHVPLMAKTSVADIILDEVVRLRARIKPSAQSAVNTLGKA
ncbi:MAG TPA: bifunctional phosphopantothenoylcysteine decarboxylase/phosphopantothenate--cysteine ligase CoaBC [Pyrinomonadaceae bacterium]|nr:bifunctional phosphopantothenoylcysteine decarboxylase/phosphopantothenate--cysteine ligase CoaBC [Pyrinomonadaceae bacterium]